MLCWSASGDGICGVSVMVKEELCKKVMEVRMLSDGTMEVALVFEIKKKKVVCG